MNIKKKLTPSKSTIHKAKSAGLAFVGIGVAFTFAPVALQPIGDYTKTADATIHPNECLPEDVVESIVHRTMNDDDWGMSYEDYQRELRKDAEVVAIQTIMERMRQMLNSNDSQIKEQMILQESDNQE